MNPFEGLPMVNEKADKRRERRALADRSTNRGSEAELTPATKDKLLWLGHTRAMIYRVLMFTLNPAVESLGIRQKGGQSGRNGRSGRKWDSPSG